MIMSLFFNSTLMTRTCEELRSARFSCLQGVCNYWVKNGIEGSIVNVSSQASMRALFNHAAYCASKAALDGLTKVMALEYEKIGRDLKESFCSHENVIAH